jgi:hypothetical protein
LAVPFIFLGLIWRLEKNNRNVRKVRHRCFARQIRQSVRAGWQGY